MTIAYHMLELGEVSVSFEPDSRLTDQSGNITQNFFDSTNSKICTVRNNGALGLTVKSLKSDDVISDIILLEKNDGSCCIEFSVGTKSKEPIISVDWVSDNQILFVTKQCLELFQLNEDKRTAKMQKTAIIFASWSIYYAKSNLLILASGSNSSVIQPIIINHGQFIKLKSFDVDYGASNSMNYLHDKDVMVASIYGKIYIMVVRYSNRNCTTTDMALYELSSDPNIASRIKYSLNLVPSSLCLPPPALYTSLWSMFQPDIVIDPIAGMMYQLKIKCNLAKNEIEDKCTLIEFLMNRNGQKVLVLSTLAECLKTKSLTLRQTRKLFNILTEKYSLSLSNVVRSGEASKCQLIPCDVEYLRIEQKELQSSLFIPLMVNFNICILFYSLSKLN
uniref:Mic1 domain-containing protein n=1 Tax=Heterorhabditis bacteriophora TaxID=37862 RepID=A0A1I7WQC4_HETBA